MPQFFVNLADFKAYGQGSNMMKEGNSIVVNKSGNTAFAAGDVTVPGGTATLALADGTTSTATISAAATKAIKIGDVLKTAGGEVLIVTSISNYSATTGGTISVLR